MYEIAYGNKYEETKGLGTKEIAAKVRGEIKALVKSGELPKAKYSVTVKRFAGGSSIDIGISKVEKEGFVLHNPERLAFEKAHPHEFTKLPRFSEEAKALEEKLEAILGAYNFDGSESMVDYFHVRFYGHVTFDWEWEAECKAKEGGAA